MASNSFGNIFKFTTFGESHGLGLGVVVDGCPAGLELSADEVNAALKIRAPGKSKYTTPRKEPDQAQIISGIFEGKTTGAPIAIVIFNKDQDSSKYEPIKNLLRPGHANYTYIEKYGIFDYRGGGRSSARETAARVAAAVIADKILQHHNIKVLAYIKSIYNQKINLNTHEIADLCYKNNNFDLQSFAKLESDVFSSPIYSLDKTTEPNMQDLIANIKDEGDSLGGVIEFQVFNAPVGLGDPVYEKIEARLASAMLSIPATKGFEIGSGFDSTRMLGSEHNDEFIESDSNNVALSTNNAGGTLGGITNGMPIVARVAFKPTSSIMKKQATVDTSGKQAEFNLPEGSRHDPCVALRAVPVVSAMVKLVLADLILMNRGSKL